MKTIINIVSAQTLPNYLFVKQMYEEGDKVIWIVSSSMQNAMQCLATTFQREDVKIALQKGEEENMQTIQQILKEKIDINENFIINLTGGTKLMAIAVYNFFRENCPNAFFFYIPWPKNIITNIQTQQTTELTSKVSIQEYFSLYDMKSRNGNGRKPYLSFEQAKDMFYKMNDIGEKYHNELSELRELKKKNRFDGDNGRNKNVPRPYSDIKGITLKEGIGGDKSTRAERIENFIEQNELLKKCEKGFISGEDMVCLTGEWLEDLIYYITEEEEKPDEILCGIEVLKNGDKGSKNELDVVYIKDNILYIRECKTGWEKGKMFNDIVYKAVAIKSLFGLSVKSSVYSCRENLSDKPTEAEQHKETLEKMGINYFGKKEIEDELNKLN
jgi:hypothetical protein